MKGNMKGFTLVELLAVIVILAIIALITIPAILNVINDAREKGAEDKAWGVIDAVRLAYTQDQGYGNSSITATSGTYTVCFADDATVDSDDYTGNACTSKKQVGSKDVKMSGDTPTDGMVKINLADGTISCDGLVFEGNGTYSCTSNGNSMTCTAQ